MRAGEQQGPSDRDGGEGHLDSRQQSVSYSLSLSRPRRGGIVRDAHAQA